MFNYSLAQSRMSGLLALIKFMTLKLRGHAHLSQSAHTSPCNNDCLMLPKIFPSGLNTGGCFFPLIVTGLTARADKKTGSSTSMVRVWSTCMFGVDGANFKKKRKKRLEMFINVLFPRRNCILFNGNGSLMLFAVVWRVSSDIGVGRFCFTFPTL